MTALGQKGATPDEFLDGAYPRMLHISFALAVAGLTIVVLLFGMTAAAGFAIGAAVTIFNFVWLHRAVEALIQRMLRGGKGDSRFRMTLGFLGRYGLVALIAYAIFKSSGHAFAAFLAALPLPILAAMCEAVYEAVLNVKDTDSANT
jgi:ATP synthase I chain